LNELVLLGKLIPQNLSIVLFSDTLHTGRALGFPDSEDGLPSSDVAMTLNNTKSLHVRADSTHVPSMLVDARKGYPIEVEVIFGEVVRMAKERGVSTPVGLLLVERTITNELFFLFQRVDMLYALLLVVQNQVLRKMQAGKPRM
jgi:2-dehydropantoate 2-reductase